MINQYVDTLQPKVSDQWHADEQFIKVKGKVGEIRQFLERVSFFEE